SEAEQQRMKEERIFGGIIARETQALRTFFGKEIAVPPLPKEATAERILEWRRLGFELHYLPRISLAEIKRDPEGKILDVIPIEFPGEKTKLRKNIKLFDEVKAGDLIPSALDLFGDWMLVDAREKPDYNNGDPMYANDVLAPALEKLREENVIKNYERKKSRFNLSAEELENPKVLETFAEALDFNTVPGLIIGLPRAIEFITLGNIFYPQWDQTTAREWFSDIRKNNRRLFGGRSAPDLPYIIRTVPEDRSDSIAFRIIARFSSNQKQAHRK
ncbi:MAG TPA: hypothetical protein VFQ60_00190, partial [Patescibacteria group bacterium]|nr:hypothetical protein [Patescibacteria group bacterium]